MRARVAIHFFFIKWLNAQVVGCSDRRIPTSAHNFNMCIYINLKMTCLQITLAYLGLQTLTPGEREAFPVVSASTNPYSHSITLPQNETIPDQSTQRYLLLSANQNPNRRSGHTNVPPSHLPTFPIRFRTTPTLTHSPTMDYMISTSNQK